jgi:hypothetical protein
MINSHRSRKIKRDVRMISIIHNAIVVSTSWDRKVDDDVKKPHGIVQ